tara:strand:+ start:13548 stop:16748 length:3201 start_codon:yes stop_codon:yes gene_type:complete
MSQAYIDYTFPFRERFYDLVTEFRGDVKVLRNRAKNPVGKVLFVIDHIPTEDLTSGKLLSGYLDSVFFELCHVAYDYYQAEYSIEELDYMVVNFNCFKTYGKSEDFKNEAKLEFGRRLKHIIAKYKPDVVHTFGRDPHYALNRDRIVESKGNDTNWLGVPVATTITVDKKKHSFKHVASLSFHDVLENKSNLTNTPNLLGYMARNMVTTLDLGEHRYKISKVTTPETGKKKYYDIEYVTTVAGVKKCLKRMAKSPYVAIDTETDSLYRVCTKLQTVQMCDDGKTAYIIPIGHKDTPFTSKELKLVNKLFRDYFEKTNKNKLQIYTNAKFDLNVMRSTFGVRYYKSDVWDIQAGEFALDENMKFLANLTGHGYYNLGNLSMQYGCDSYLTNAFGKEERATIHQVDLSGDVLDYCALDVIIPWRIYFKQIDRANDIDYRLYHSIAGELISDQVNTFSILESTGAYTDVEYLFKLEHPNSPINQEIAKIEAQIYTSDAVRKVNKMISADRDVPAVGLGGMRVQAKDNFSLNKEEHKQMLFFDVLELEPVGEPGKKLRSNGKPQYKLDKDFQKTHGDNELVKLFSDWQKACKLRNAYVKNLLKLWATNEDFKNDQRIRPNYSYLGVVTGRTSASDPNLQQVPSRSVLGKLIKRLFASREGKLLIKVDYSAHEVRGWSIISGDQGVSDLFQTGTDLRNRFRVVPDPLIARRIVDEGDVHRLNASYFFGIPITMREKIAEVRNSVKTVIFGLIYQQGDNGLAKTSGRTVKEIVDLKAKFLDRFPVGLKWFDKVKNFARKNLFVESPLGRRRHLWALMLPKDYPHRGFVVSSQERRSVNSPVQGFGSDFMMIGIRAINRLMYEHYEETGHYPDMHLSVSVHDSLTVEVAYEDVWLALDFIEKGLTTEAARLVKERIPGFEFTSIPEIDYEIGATEKHVKGWDFSFESMKELIKLTLETQVNELGYDVDIDEAYHTIMETQYQSMPDWMKKQLWSNNIKIESRGKDIRTLKEKKIAAKYLKELPGNIKELERRMAEEAEKSANTASVGKTSLKKAILKARKKRKALRKYLEETK